MSAPEQPLITSVPGFEGQPPANPGEQIGQPTVVEGFRGDPRRVIGHPGNPTNETTAALTQRLAEQGEAEVAPPIPAGQATEWGETTLQGMGVEAPAATPPATEAPGPKFEEPAQPFGNANVPPAQGRTEIKVVRGA